MSLLLSEASLAARTREVATDAGDLAVLAASLRDDLRTALAHPLAVPREKAMLSRPGGRCPRHGVALEFDPFRPHDHVCPVDGEIERGERHDRWWIMWYQSWLAERVVHASALAALGVDPPLADFAARVLDEYAERYLSYPNRDNVLGPSRPFFSTYLESIWVLQLGLALDLLESAGLAGPTTARVRDRVLAPSLALLRSYDEAASNRQVWNNAAIIALGTLLDDRAAVDRAMHGPSGIVSHLTNALLVDGTWYEGENYHLFAHRGLWYGVTMLERLGGHLPAALRARFDEGFATPLLTALPDFTFPARRDAQYGVSLRQWRFAESCELGLARGDDPRLLGALWTLYEDGAAERRDTGRWRSTAESERNEPAAALTRSDLGWRSLLFARAALPHLAPWPVKSALLEGQGFAVIRRDAARTYVALDYGHSGGGHGHPDRLNVILSHGIDRWLDDMGTGSYVDPSLHWYRSSLAHNAPFAEGRSQRSCNGVLRAYDERGGAGWVDAAVPLGGIAQGVGVRRSLVAMPDYALDRCAWHAASDSRIDLPVHFDGDPPAHLAFRSARPELDDAGADGFQFVRDAAVAGLGARSVTPVMRDGRAALWLVPSEPAELWRMTAPGAPGQGERRLYMVRMRGTGGCLIAVWDWAGVIARVEPDAETTTIRMADGTVHVHSLVRDTWHVDFRAYGARSSVDLDGRRPAPSESERAARAQAAARADLPLPVAPAPPLSFILGRDAYRTSEDTWEEAGAPSAVVSLGVVGGGCVVEVDVRKAAPAFRSAAAPDPELDNEHPDIHSDGVQLYIAADDWLEPAGWLLVPDAATGQVRIRRVHGTRTDVPLAATWRPTGTGYAMRCVVPLEALRRGGARAASLQVVVNDMDASRERRRGQLVLTGGAGQRVYLRGDRESRDDFLRVRLGDG